MPSCYFQLSRSVERAARGAAASPPPRRPGAACRWRAKSSRSALNCFWCVAHQAVRRACVDLERGVLDHLRRAVPADRDRHDLVVVAVDDQRRDVELLQVLGEVGLGERLDAIVGGGKPACMPGARTIVKALRTLAPGRLAP